MFNLHICFFLLLFCFTYIDTSKENCSENGEENCKEKTEGSCRLPLHPEFGNWSIIGASITPKTFAAPLTVLKVECNKGYVLKSDSYLFCNNGNWSSEIGQCLKTCPPIVSTSVMRVTCIHKNMDSKNCTNAVEGTTARFVCSPFYEDAELEKRPVHICRNGTWDQPKPHCLPVCGQKTKLTTSLIGSPKTKTDYPWQVALYNKSDKVLLCGGSLLSLKIVLTAAHCVTDLNGKLNPKENYIVAVGKYYRQFDDTRDQEFAQFSDLQDMFVPNEYNGEIQNYFGDIAILVTSKTLTFSPTVQPVCINSDYEYYLNKTTQYGFVPGWGFTHENSKPANVLTELMVSPISISQCKNDLPEDYLKLLTRDKLCAGYAKPETSTCRGDSGSGLVFQHQGRYHVAGVVSTSPIHEDGCASQQYGFYTNVSVYLNSFILPKLAEFQS